MCGLPRSQQPNNQESVSFTFSQKIIGLTKSSLAVHLARFDQCLPSNEDQRRRQIGDGLQNLL